MKTRRNDVGQKVRNRLSGHIAKIVAAAKQSAEITTQAIADLNRTREVEKLAQAAKTCRATLNDTANQLIAAHDAALALNKKGDVTAYKVRMESITNQMAPAVQRAKTELRAVNDKLMRAGLEIMAERWDLLAAGNPYRARGCDHRLELIEAALSSNKPKRSRKKAEKYIEL